MIEKLRALFRRDRLDELDEELRLHLERMEEANRRAGMSADEARRAARLAFGNPLALRESAREPYLFRLERSPRTCASPHGGCAVRPPSRRSRSPRWRSASA